MEEYNIADTERSEFESFFITMIDSKTNKNTNYLKLPQSTCFSYCIKEILHLINNEMAGKVKTENSNYFIKIFYDFMLYDTIFKKVDYLQYSNILLTLKSYAEGNKVALKEKYAFFYKCKVMYIKKYKDILYDLIKNQTLSGKIDKNTYEYTNNFINELLASGMDYLYLGYLVKLYKENKFKCLEDFVEYLYGKKPDSFDIYLPITRLSEKEKDFFAQQNQKLEEFNNVVYCKIYDNNTNDFFHVIKENFLRIESLFNMLRLYTNSNNDFNKEEKIIVRSKVFNDELILCFDDILRYIGATPYSKNLKQTVASLEIIKDSHEYRQDYFKILNAISYAEKDKDIMSASSYVDNWISLETLMSMNGYKTGFDAVTALIPKILSAKMILNNATNTLKFAYNNYKGLPMKLERFLKMVKDNTFDIKKIMNPYYKLEIQKMIDNFNDIKMLEKEFVRVEKKIECDLYRLYMLRNEYVHASNLQAFNSMQHFYIKQILPNVFDEFFRALNVKIKKYATLI